MMAKRGLFRILFSPEGIRGHHSRFRATSEWTQSWKHYAMHKGAASQAANPLGSWPWLD
jgi:hypothetical protein